MSGMAVGPVFGLPVRATDRSGGRSGLDVDTSGVLRILVLVNPAFRPLIRAVPGAGVMKSGCNSGLAVDTPGVSRTSVLVNPAFGPVLQKVA